MEVGGGTGVGVCVAVGVGVSVGGLVGSGSDPPPQEANVNANARANRAIHGRRYLALVLPALPVFPLRLISKILFGLSAGNNLIVHLNLGQRSKPPFTGLF